MYAFQLVAPLIPFDCPAIIESVVTPDRIEREMHKTAALFAQPEMRARSLEVALSLAE
jgi:hypothetical protein